VVGSAESPGVAALARSSAIFMWPLGWSVVSGKAIDQNRGLLLLRFMTSKPLLMHEN
jgi:hypothetical protein